MIKEIDTAQQLLVGGEQNGYEAASRIATSFTTVSNNIESGRWHNRAIDWLNTPLLDDPSKSLAALNDFLSMANIGHQNWYKGVMPKMMDKYGKNKIGTQRTEGSPRDAAEEFAGAADYGQRAPADYNRAVDNASLYQRFHNTGKNATENFAQDQAGLALGMCNPEMSKKDIIKQSIQYGLNPADYLR